MCLLVDVSSPPFAALSSVQPGTAAPLAWLVVGGGVALLVGGLLFEELRRVYEGVYLRGGVELLLAGRLPLVLGWLASDVSFSGNYVVASTTQRWQAGALRNLLGEPEKYEFAHFTVTLRGLKPAVEMQ